MDNIFAITVLAVMGGAVVYLWRRGNKPGPRGATGADGPEGHTGPQGDQGDTGEKGERGPAGVVPKKK